MCAVAGAPVQPPLLSPSMQPLPPNQQLSRIGDSSNGVISTTPTTSPVPPTFSPRLVGLTATSPVTHSENKHLTSLSKVKVLDEERPVLTPKLRAQIVPTVPAGRGNYSVCDEDVYNIPRQEFSPQTVFQQDDETYDTPPRLLHHVSYPCEDTYDLLPKLYRDKYEDTNSHEEVYDSPPKLCRGKAKDVNDNDDVYDVPPTPPSSATKHCMPPSNRGEPARHSSADAVSSMVVDAVDTELGEMLCSDTSLVSAKSSVTDSEEDYEVVVSSRTRSFQSARNWYVFSEHVYSFNVGRSRSMKCWKKSV